MKKTSKKMKRTQVKRKTAASRGSKLGLLGSIWKKIRSL
jgi:hypothetical protein